VVVAVRTVGVMQVAGYQVIDVVAVRKGLVPAARAVPVSSRMPAAGMVRDTAVGIGRANRHPMVVDVAPVDVVQVPVVQEVDVSFVADSSVPATRPVGVTAVIRVLRTAHFHRLRSAALDLFVERPTLTYVRNNARENSHPENQPRGRARYEVPDQEASQKLDPRERPPTVQRTPAMPEGDLIVTLPTSLACSTTIMTSKGRQPDSDHQSPSSAAGGATRARSVSPALTARRGGGRTKG
jgi:hypothetical protein